MNRQGIAAVGWVIGLFAVGCFDPAQAQSSLAVSSNSLSFTAQTGSNTPLTQSVVVTSPGGSVTFTISSDSSWLTASTGLFNGSSGATPATLIVQVNASNLAAQTYNGTLTLKSTDGSSTVTIAVSLTVNQTVQITASPSSLSLSFQVNHSTQPTQVVQLQSSGPPVTFSFAASTTTAANCPQNWLQPVASSNTTPSTLTISIVPIGLTAGICSGTILISYTNGSGNATASIPVSLYVSNGPLLNVSAPPALSSLSVEQGLELPAQYIALTSTDLTTPISYTASAFSSTSGWLAVANPNGGSTVNVGGQTPSNPYALIVTAGLAPGIYTGSVTIASSGLLAGSMVIPVKLTVTPSSNITMSTSGPLTFVQTQGGPVPSTQTLYRASGPIINFVATVTPISGGNWLQVSPTSGSSAWFSWDTPLTVSVLPNHLTQGNYSSQITLSFPNSSTPQIVIGVTLSVTAPPVLTASPAALSFSYPSGGTLPAAQTVTLSGDSATFSAAANANSWLSVSPANGMAPANLTVSVNPQGLATGTYTATITISSAGTQAAAVSVMLYVSASQTPQPFIISNSASNSGGVLSPGEIISIKGTGLGPSPGVSFTVNAQGTVDSTLAGVQVLFDGIPGTPLYVSATQINVIVPWELDRSGKTSTNVIVSYQGAQSTPNPQQLLDAALGIFTLDGTGQGQAVVLNQDYTVNGPALPAAQGSVIVVYATGGGQTNPASTDGMVNPTSTTLSLRGLPLGAPFGLFDLPPPFTATIGGMPAKVLFAGAAPGYVTGVVQLNIQVPTGVFGSALPLVVQINGSFETSTTPSGPTISVQ